MQSKTILSTVLLSLVSGPIIFASPVLRHRNAAIKEKREEFLECIPPEVVARFPDVCAGLGESCIRCPPKEQKVKRDELFTRNEELHHPCIPLCTKDGCIPCPPALPEASKEKRAIALEEKVKQDELVARNEDFGIEHLPICIGP